MKIQIDRKELKAAIDAIKTCFVVRKDLSNSNYATAIKIEATKDALKLITSNGETFYTWTANPSTYMVEEEGSVIAPAEKFQNIALKHAEKIEMAYMEGLLYLKCGSAKTEAKTIFEKDFPTVKVKKPEVPIRMTNDTTEMFSKLLHTMYRDPSKPKMVGMLMDLNAEGKTVTFKSVSPNKISRLVDSYQSDEPVTTRIVVPCFLADEMGRHKVNAIGVNKSTLVTQFEQLEIQTPMQEDVFINPDNAFNIQGEKDVTFKTAELTDALTFIKNSSSKDTRKAKFSVSAKEAEITCFTETGKTSERVDCSTETETTFSVNSEYILEMLGSVKTENVEFKITEKLLSYKEGNYHYISTLYLQG
jgi:DNA polymerase III sliding clamp (beta) subunit (PCNA family)